MWRKRSPMIVRIERELEPKMRARHGAAFAVVTLVAFFTVNILLNAFDTASKGAQWTIIGLVAVIAFAALLRHAAKSADVSIGEYLCSELFRSHRRGWD